MLIGNHLSRHGHTIKPCEELAVRLRLAGWDVLAASSRLSPAARLAEMTACIWRERGRYAVANVDVYSGRAFAWAEASAYSLRACGKPFTVTLHGGGLPEFAARSPRRVRRLLALARAVVAPSAYLAESFRPWRADIAQIANGIEVRRYRFRERSQAVPRLLWLRSFHDTYAPELAIEALALLRRDVPQATLAMIGPDKGDGSLARSMEAAEQLGVRDAVQFEGLLEKERVPDRIAKADIFLNTSRVDNSPVSVIEAMAAGLCVVSARVGGVPLLAEDQVDSLLTPPGDAAAIATAVRRILHQPGLSARLSLNARRKAESFDWSVVTPQWERMFVELGGLC